MKHIILRIFLGGLASFFFLNTQVFSQESSTSNSGQLEVVLPNYQYEYIPDFTYEEVAGRIEKMELEMDFELNDRVFSFIQYFTVRNREYTKMVLARKEQYFPMYEETMKDHGMPLEIQHLSIIESGLDIPNANTIIINQAQNFGLSDLHQMRGRVGRSNRKAFCYFI